MVAVGILIFTSRPRRSAWSNRGRIDLLHAAAAGGEQHAVVERAVAQHDKRGPVSVTGDAREYRAAQPHRLEAAERPAFDLRRFRRLWLGQIARDRQPTARRDECVFLRRSSSTFSAAASFFASWACSCRHIANRKNTRRQGT